MFLSIKFDGLAGGMSRNLFRESSHPIYYLLEIFQKNSVCRSLRGNETCHFKKQMRHIRKWPKCNFYVNYNEKFLGFSSETFRVMKVTIFHFCNDNVFVTWLLLFSFFNFLSQQFEQRGKGGMSSHRDYNVPSNVAISMNRTAFVDLMSLVWPLSHPLNFFSRANGKNSKSRIRI